MSCTLKMLQYTKYLFSLTFENKGNNVLLNAYGAEVRCEREFPGDISRLVYTTKHL